jgi:hypothetical protein
MNFLDYKRSRNIPDGVSPLGFKVGDRVRLPEWQDTPESEVVPEEIGTVVSIPDDQSAENINRNMIVVQVDDQYVDADDPSDDGLREVGDDQVERL